MRIHILQEADGPPVDVILNDAALPAGHIVVLWYTDEPGIYRVVMETSSGFRSFGDIEFE